MKIPKGGVAIFDSGIGGMTVLDVCRKRLPNTLFYYYGDNRHAPYGNLSPKEIYRRTDRAFRLFRRLKVRAAVIACNTATAVCVERLRKKYSFPIIGADPAVCAAAKKGGRIFVLSTRATYESLRFKALCKAAGSKYPQATIKAYPCDDLAGEIEHRLPNTEYDFTKHLPNGKPDAVVLGCTHYIYIKKAVERFYGCEAVDGNEGIASRLTFVLKSTKNVGARTRPNFFRDWRPCLTTFVKKKQNSNAHVSQKGQNPPKNSVNFNIFFLGRCKKANKIQYEQMFACNHGRKFGESGG